jgi:hypothetical protein
VREIEAEIEEIGNLLVIFPKDHPVSRKKQRLGLKDLIEADRRMFSLKTYYSQHLYDACERCILVSLNKLAEACGYKLQMVMNPDDEFVNKLFPGEDNPLTSNLRDASFMSDLVRLKSFDDLVVVSAKDRRTSLTSTISRATWSEERKLQDAFLK